MGKKILVVEDDLLNRMFLSDSLRSQGFDVREEADGAKVLGAVREFGPDLVTMDINLPHVSGDKLIRSMKQDGELRDIPVLAITACVGALDEDWAREAGASCLLAKPVAMRPLLDSVKTLLADRDAVRRGLTP